MPSTKVSGLLIVSLSEGYVMDMSIRLTTTVTLSVNVPHGPMAVMVYVVVSVGDTVMEPFSVTSPIPLSIVTVVALIKSHVRVVASPIMMTQSSADMFTRSTR